MSAMDGFIICLDSGTSAVKAAAFDRRGRVIAATERLNSALRREGDRVEQDMEVTRNDALETLRDCIAKVPGRPEALIITGQGDGLWPIDAAGQPAGRAMTWLDGRARPIVAELGRSGRFNDIEAITSAQPTAASQSLQLLWLQRHDRSRLQRIVHALRLKEWLFFSLTGCLKAEPSSVVPVWGDWRRRAPVRMIEEILGLDRGIDLLPPLQAIGECVAGLSEEAARYLEQPSGLPVFLGPGDVQASLIGLGLGLREGLSRASIFGTSAIHARYMADPGTMAWKPPGAMFQPFALGSGYLCFHPSFNGATTFTHVAGLFANVPASITTPAYSGIILHPFFEPGGERAPVTSPHASAAAFGLSAATQPEEFAWAAREALAFLSRYAHDMMGGSDEDLVVGGGVAGDAAYMQFLSTTIHAKVRPAPGGQAGLRGLAAIAATLLGWATGKELAENFAVSSERRVLPEDGAVRVYAEKKYEIFKQLLETLSASWADIAAIRNYADMTTAT